MGIGYLLDGPAVAGDAGNQHPAGFFAEQRDLHGVGAFGQAQLCTDFVPEARFGRGYGKTTVGVIRSTFVVDADGNIEKALYGVKATGHVARLRAEVGA